ncbi:BRCT domain-containing protein, partial [archaeon]
MTMGGEMKSILAKDVTHYICSNVDDRDTLAAQLMNIHVVSPLWVTQCMESEQRASEEDFSISTALLRKVEEWIGPGRYHLADRPARLSEPIPNRAQSGRSLDSPSFSSSQRYRREAEKGLEPPLPPS